MESRLRGSVSCTESLLEGIVRRVIRDEIAAALGQQPFRLALSLPDAATAAGYSLDRIRKAIRDNELVPSYANSKPVIMVEELTRWLRGLPDARV